MSMYGVGNKKGSMLTAAMGGNGIYITSPTSGKQIPVKEVVIPSSMVITSVYKCKYNTRNWALMTPVTVMDILASIRVTGRNITPAIAVQGENGRYEIISGMKRSFAVSISPETSLVLHVASEMSEEDKQKIAFVSDLTERPSILDTALTLNDMKNELGDKFNIRDAGAIIGISKSAVAEFLKFAALPTELFKLFPGASYVSWTFLRAVVNSSKSNEEIKVAIRDIASIKSDVDRVLVENARETLKAECKALEGLVLSAIIKKQGRPKLTKTFDENSPFHESKLPKGVDAKVGGRGSVSITFKKEFLNSELGQSLINLISSQD